MIAANFIYENKIVGYFNGRMEFGARALGNRSILANPCNPNIKEIISETIEFCPIYKPNFAFFERYGSKGYRLLEKINGNSLLP